MDNDTYDDRHSTQQTFNRNIVKRIQELEDKRPSKLDDQVDIKLMKQEEFNEKGLKRLITLENKFEIMEKFHNLNSDSLGDHTEWIINLQDKQEKQIKLNDQTLIRLDQEIENRTKAFERIEELEEQFRLLEQYTVKGLTESLRELRYDMDIKLETIDDILVVHRNQNDTQRKNHASLIKVWDEKVIPLIEGTHGKEE